ncbi:hypothetical protein [uncultured Devosia sp.]|uniref:hypothetical protein n=1 Tax=uncultured Devosia sp. TaxID=211434 RepID=UPI00262EAC68|nr:hypothetical protein [uncultured Devosia sp.]
MNATLSSFDQDSEAMATELIEKIGRVIDLAHACADHSLENAAIIIEGREALDEVAAFFEVDPPGSAS